MKLSIKSMCLCSLFAVLIAVGAFIKIPISIVPITLQTLFVVLAGIILGKRDAFISVLLYIVIGLIGIPVFANGGGIAYVLQPSFGYLLGFMLVAYFIGYFSESVEKSVIKLIVIAFLGMLLIYCIGMLYFALIQHFYYELDFTLEWLFYYLLLVYLPGDSLACILAGWIGYRLITVKMIEKIRKR
ncbi:MAG: biotin transporter BioY [Erysipelotrichia bacterium]|nr:biotin transporter BioY [Erysipelotrichia bacterium]